MQILSALVHLISFLRKNKPFQNPRLECYAVRKEREMNLTTPLCGGDWKANPELGWGGAAAGGAQSADVRVDWASGKSHPGTTT